MVKRLRVVEKKLTNSGPLRESADKHSIYTIKNRRFRGEIIRHGVWLSYRFTLRYRNDV